MRDFAVLPAVVVCLYVVSLVYLHLIVPFSSLSALFLYINEEPDDSCTFRNQEWGKRTAKDIGNQYTKNLVDFLHQIEREAIRQNIKCFDSLYSAFHVDADAGDVLCFLRLILSESLLIGR